MMSYLYIYLVEILKKGDRGLMNDGNLRAAGRESGGADYMEISVGQPQLECASLNVFSKII